MGKHTDSKVKDKPRHTTSYFRLKPGSSALSENSQPNSARRSHMPVHSSSSRRMIRKRAQHEVLHSVLTFLLGREQATLSIRRHSFHHQRRRQMSQPPLASPLVTDAATLVLLETIQDFLPTRPSGSSNGLPKGPTLWISFRPSLRGPNHRHRFLYFLLLSKPRVLWSFRFTRFLAFDRLVQLLVLIIHGHSFWSFDAQ